jgi:predicted RNA-binding protein
MLRPLAELNQSEAHEKYSGVKVKFYMARYWINTISKDHVQAGVKGGFTQADHGKNTRLKRLSKGDYLIFYSPKTSLKDGETLQAFTAIGIIEDDAPYQVEMTPDFHPWRRKVKFLKSEEVGIKLLLEHLTFIKGKQRWGYPFRMGLFEIQQGDFELIANAMCLTVKL